MQQDSKNNNFAAPLLQQKKKNNEYINLINLGETVRGMFKLIGLTKMTPNKPDVRLRLIVSSVVNFWLEKYNSV